MNSKRQIIIKKPSQIMSTLFYVYFLLAGESMCMFMIDCLLAPHCWKRHMMYRRLCFVKELQFGAESTWGCLPLFPLTTIRSRDRLSKVILTSGKFRFSGWFRWEMKCLVILTRFRSTVSAVTTQKLPTWIGEMVQHTLAFFALGKDPSSGYRIHI